MSEFEISRRNFLKFAAALGAAAAVPISAIEVMAAPTVEKAARFIGPRLEFFVDGEWIQIPGLTEVAALPRVIEATASYFAADMPKRVVGGGIADDGGYRISGFASIVPIEIQDYAGTYPMRIVWNDFHIEFEGFFREFSMIGHVGDQTQWDLVVSITTPAKITFARS